MKKLVLSLILACGLGFAPAISAATLSDTTAATSIDSKDRGQQYDSDDSHSSGGMILGIIGAVLGAIGCGLAVVAFLSASKSAGVISDLQARNKKLEVAFGELRDNLSSEVRAQDNILDDLQAKVEKMERNAVRSQPAPEAQPSYQRPAIKEEEPRSYYAERESYQPAPKEVSFAEKVVEETPKPQANPSTAETIYVGLLKDGVFSSPKAEYVPSKTLYKITTIDGVKGKVEIIDKKEVLNIVRRSITSWIEPVCDIIGAMPETLNKIHTVTPGEVTKTGAGWNLTNKAVVELS